MKYLPNVPILFRVSRESHYFDLGLEVGKIELYCQSVIDMVISAIAADIHSSVFGTRRNAWSYLTDYEEIVARFAFVVGCKMDLEKIWEDVNFVYEHIRSVVDTHFPNWNNAWPGQFKVRVTPGSFDFLVEI